MRYRNVLITAHNYVLTDFTHNLDNSSIFSYYCFQEEIGEGTQRQHIQFYGELSKQIGLKNLKKAFKDETIHVESRKGTQKQAIDYCTKLETRKEGTKPHIWGTPKTPGKRNDILLVKEMVKKGDKLSTIIDTVESPNFQVIRTAMLLIPIYSVKRMTKPLIFWFYGSTGSGKSKTVYQTFDDIYTTMDTGRWFDGYEQNKVILVDDYRNDFMKFHILLKFIDRYPFKREIKGSTVNINSPFIIFTSPKHPYEMWKGRCSEDIKQLTRRIDAVFNMDLLNEIKSRKNVK